MNAFCRKQRTRPALMFLSHRIPYPPDKGDKIRSYNVLRFLAEDYDVYLGSFYDDPNDKKHIDAIAAICAEVCILPLGWLKPRIRSLGAFFRAQPLTMPFYRDARLLNWVNGVAKRKTLAATYVFSSSMAQYVPLDDATPFIVDFVDVDSDKWAQYAASRRRPMRWVFAREARTLGKYEVRLARTAHASLFVSEPEADLVRARMANDSKARIEVLRNGVDTDFFTPDKSYESPYRPSVVPIVFTGAMDYWANVDAVTWFATEIFPAIRARIRNATFFIVGQNPTSEVLKLESEDVIVTGRVEDIRPYLQHASLAVAPMRVARGVQNKILEALSMQRCVLTTTKGLEGIKHPRVTPRLHAILHKPSPTPHVTCYVQVQRLVAVEPANSQSSSMDGNQLS